MLIHPAHTVPFDELTGLLKQAATDRFVYERTGVGGLRLYVYSEHCVYDGAWSLATIVARGLILDVEHKRIAATPFPKFFNAGERGEPIPDLPFRAYEKLDGSLIIIYHHDGQWRTATKGSFESPQAIWAREQLQKLNLANLEQDTTYLAEAVYPENRIVVRYEEPALVMLGAYGSDGLELEHDSVVAAARGLGVRMAKTYAYDSFAGLQAHAKTLPRSEEGFVVRFSSGQRLKIKGDEYKRIHALISNVTPLAIWDIMRAGDDLETVRRDLPEEFWGDFDAIVACLKRDLQSLLDKLAAEVERVKNWTDKEVGLQLATIDPAVKGLLFDARKSEGNVLDGRSRRKVFDIIRPASNVLPGYKASYAIRQALSDDG
jgi:RNA ligase